MKIALYFSALYTFMLAGYGLHRCYDDLGSRPATRNAEIAAAILGGPVSLIGALGLLALGFLTWPWWVPILALPVSSFLAGWTYGRMPIGATYAVLGGPVGIALGVAWFAAS